MAETNHGGEHGHGGNLFRLYMIVAAVLAVCTISSFLFNWMARGGTITVFMSFLLILSVAILKATLVGMYFMHLKWDWSLLYFLIVPAFILGAMMMVVLMPDVLIAPTREAREEYEVSRDVDKTWFPKRAQ